MNGGSLQFVKGAFRTFVEVLFWIIPIGCAVAGGVIGSGSYYDSHIFYGIVIGLVVGFLTDIIGGGITATLLAIEQNTAETNENIIEMLGILRAIASRSSSSNRHVADEYGRIDYRTWYDPDSGKHESWFDANGNKHET